MIGLTVLFNRGNRARKNPEEQCQQHCTQAKLDRNRKPGLDQFRYGVIFILKGWAKIAFGQVNQIIPELFMHGFIEIVGFE